MLDFCYADGQCISNLFDGRLALLRLLQRVRSMLDFADRLVRMDRQADAIALIRYRADHALPNPPGRVGGESVAPGIIEFLESAYQSKIAFLDEIHQRKVISAIF